MIPLLKEVQAAAYLGVAPATLRRWRVEGNGPVYIKVGRAVRYQAHVLDTYVERNLKTSTSSAVGA